MAGRHVLPHPGQGGADGPALGYYSNIWRGTRKETEDDRVPCIPEADKSLKEYRKNWARLNQKIYEEDPLTCPTYQGRMKIIAFPEDEEVIEKILRHLGLWEVKVRTSPKVKVSYITISILDSDFQIPFHALSFYPDQE